MKKTLAALAVLTAFAGTAAAAEVTLYGKVDLGLNYQNTDVNGTDTSTFQQKSGQFAGSRFGLKGTEDLGNGLKVGFVLENGFTPDDGNLAQGGRLFGRQATVYVNGGFGEIAFGRVGSLTSGLGSYSFIYNYAPFSTGWGDTAGAQTLFDLSDRDRFDNTVTYVTPSFAGLKVYAQYSFSTSGQEAAGNERNNKRYAGIGANYEAGAFSAGIVVDTILNNHLATNTTNQEDSLGISVGAAYDFGVLKLHGFAQYGASENKFGDFTTSVGTEGVDGYTLTLGVIAPVAGGTLYAQASYADAENAQSVAGTADQEFDRVGGAIGYSYNLSKRTTVYGFGAYSEGTVEQTGAADTKTKNTEVGFGILHNF
ncbi:porin [Sutterella sp.]|uniref:porin n=1 Tax=Sutterella sp. TaxID=1981025 RepID=UPI0026E10D94|nr:porin [Sutterella sp.]MDO5532458.1 porin [Sutterella sp.]